MIADLAATDAKEFWLRMRNDGGPHFADEQLKKVWNVKEKPRIVSEVKAKFSPLLEKYVEALYREVQDDPRVTSNTKNALVGVFKDYADLKKAAEELDEKATIVEFQTRINAARDRLIRNGEPLMNEARKSLERSL